MDRGAGGNETEVRAEHIVQRARSLMLNPGQTLSQRVIQGGFWVFALRIVSRGLSLVRTVVLARVLAPEDFGLMGIAMLAMSTLETFSQTGFQPALIQKQEDVEDYLDTAWTISALRGVVLFALLYSAAPYIARFFDTPAATPIMRVISISELLKGLTNVGVVYFRKELEFNKQFIYQLSGTLADLTVAVAAALLLQSVWALVFGVIAGNLVRMLVSYAAHSYRPRLVLDWTRVVGLLGFSKWILGSGILLFLITQGDDIFVGKLLGVTALGFYQMAYRVSNIPATEITSVITRVTFPAYSKLQGEISALRSAYFRTLQLTAFLSLPVAGLIFALSPSFTRVFLGEQWTQMIPTMRVLVWWGAIRSMAGANSAVLQAIGRPDIVTKLSAIKLVVLAILIYPLSIRWGTVGTSLAVLISAVLITPNTFRWTAKVALNSEIGLIVDAISVPFLGTALVVLPLAVFVPESLSLLEFVLIAAIGVVCYCSVTYALDKVMSRGLRYNLRRLMSETVK